jgi:hypothetical protein
MLRVVVTGSRHWTDEETIRRALANLPRSEGVHLGHGNARGADRIAAHALGFRVTAYPVEKRDGPWPGAGPRRNSRMLTEHSPHVVIAFRAEGKSRGTDGCVKDARRRGLSVRVISPTPSSPLPLP